MALAAISQRLEAACLGDDGVEDFEQEISISPGEAEWRFDAECLAMQATFANEQTQFTCAFQHFKAFLFGWLFAGPVSHQFHSNHQAAAAHVANEFVFSLEFL